MGFCDLHFGIKFFIIIGSFVGIKSYHIVSKKWKWINTIQNIYHYVVFVVHIGLFPIEYLRFYHTGEDVKGNSSDTMNYLLNTVLSPLSISLWVLMYTYITIYTKFYFANLSKLVSKLLVLRSAFGKKLRPNYFTFFISLLLSIIFIIIPFLPVFKPIRTEKASYYIIGFYNFYAHCVAVIFCNIFFSLVEQLASIAEEVKNEVYSSGSTKSSLKLPKKFRLNFHTIFENKYFDGVFKKKLLALLIITEEIFSYFQMSISLIFLNNLVFIIKEVTRIAIASDYRLDNLYIISVNALQIGAISYLTDAIHEKTVALANVLYKMAADEESFEKRNQIYGICKILERFPKISFFGFFTIGRHCLLPILSSFITYLIVGFQFSLSNTGGSNDTRNS